MFSALLDHGAKVLKPLLPVAGLNLDDAQERARIVVRRFQLKNQGQFLSSPLRVAPQSQQLRELEADVVELGAKPERAPELVHGVFGAIDL